MYKTFFFLLAFMSGTAGLFAQTVTQGTVLNDATGEPLQGAHISLSPTPLSTISRLDGGFEFRNLRSGAYELEISFLGYEKMTVPLQIPLQKPLQIRMKRKAFLQDEYIVSATRIKENVPTAINTISSKTIEKLNVGHDLPYLLQNIPSVVTSSDGGAGIGYTSFRIRGTDMTRINVMVNGIPLNDPESNQVYWVDLPDISSSAEEIQVQRGVATSAYGNSAFGAGLNLSTTRPSPDAFAEISSTVGSYNTFRQYVKFGTGLLANHLSFEGRLSHITSDGYVDRASSALKSFFITGGYYGKTSLVKFNIFSGHERTYQAWNGVPSDSLSTNRTYNPSGEYLGMDGRVKYYDNEVDDYQQDHYQLFFNHFFSDNLYLNAALHYTRGYGYYENYKTDRDFADYGFSDLIIGGDTITSTDIIQRKYLDNHYGGATLSVNYKAAENLSFTLGTAYNYYHGDHFGRVIWARLFPGTDPEPEWYSSNGVKKEFNSFLKTEWLAVKGLSFYADLQFRSVNHSMNGINDDLRDLTQEHAYDFFNPKGGLSWQINPLHRVWASVGIANREPNRSDFKDADQGKTPKNERLIDFEAAYEFQSAIVKAGINLFYMDYTDQLVLTGKINNTGDPVMVNVPSSYRAGMEILATVKPAKRLSLTAHATFSTNKINNFVAYVDDWDTYSQQEESLGTTDLSFSPSVTSGMQVQVEPLKRLILLWNARYIGKQYIDNTSNDARVLDAYFVNDLNIRFSFENAFFRKITLWAQLNNLFDELYESNAWVYRYYAGGKEYKMDGYFPQATRNFLAGVTFAL